MSIKSNPTARAADVGHFAITAPRPSDIMRSALHEAFDTDSNDTDFSALLARIDQADRAYGRVSRGRGRG